MPQLFTRKDYDRLPEGFPAQLVEGLLVKESAPTYGHQRIESRILALLAALVGPDRALPSPPTWASTTTTSTSPTSSSWRRSPRTTCATSASPSSPSRSLSPSTRDRDRDVKTRHLLDGGCRGGLARRPATGHDSRCSAQPAAARSAAPRPSSPRRCRAFASPRHPAVHARPPVHEPLSHRGRIRFPSRRPPVDRWHGLRLRADPCRWRPQLRLPPRRPLVPRRRRAIDPSFAPELVLERAEDQGLEIELILNTHGHPTTRTATRR